MPQVNTLSAVLRTNQAYCELLCEKQTLRWGIAFHSAAWPAAPETNQFREVVIRDATQIPQAFEAVQAFFQERGVACRTWAPAMEQPTEALATFLIGRGFRRRDTVAMGLAQWPELPARKDLRILPARAMREAYEATFLAEGVGAGKLAQAALERLDDPRMDVHVAVQGNRPVGRAALFAVGDIGRVKDFYVVPDGRRGGVATTLMAHLLTLGKRWGMRQVCLQADEGDRAAAFFERCGFTRDATICEFDAPGVT